MPIQSKISDSTQSRHLNMSHQSVEAYINKAKNIIQRRRTNPKSDVTGQQDKPKPPKQSSFKTPVELRRETECYSTPDPSISSSDRPSTNNSNVAGSRKYDFEYERIRPERVSAICNGCNYSYGYIDRCDFCHVMLCYDCDVNIFEHAVYNGRIAANSLHTKGVYCDCERPIPPLALNRRREYRTPDYYEDAQFQPTRFNWWQQPIPAEPSYDDSYTDEFHDAPSSSNDMGETQTDHQIDPVKGISTNWELEFQRREARLREMELDIERREHELEIEKERILQEEREAESEDDDEDEDSLIDYSSDFECTMNEDDWKEKDMELERELMLRRNGPYERYCEGRGIVIESVESSMDDFLEPVEDVEPYLSSDEDDDYEDDDYDDDADIFQEACDRLIASDDHDNHDEADFNDCSSEFDDNDSDNASYYSSTEADDAADHESGQSDSNTTVSDSDETPAPRYQCPRPNCMSSLPTSWFERPVERFSHLYENAAPGFYLRSIACSPTDYAHPRVDGPTVRCPQCNAVICRECRQLYHPGYLCKNTPGIDPKLAGLLEKEGIQRWPNCREAARKFQEK